jgi:bisphosphoglycerate-independent phosphoglycerate mutase (AlkP superfamily)
VLVVLDGWGLRRTARATPSRRPARRVQLAYDLLIHGAAEYSAATGQQAAREAYERDDTDEFIKPVLVGDEGRIRSGDSVIAFNFRPDRMREITQALADADFGEIDCGDAEPIDRCATMTRYEGDWSYPVACPPEHPGDHTVCSCSRSSSPRRCRVGLTDLRAELQ